MVTTAHELYRRWIDELCRAGRGATPEGAVSYFGNDILRVDGDRFVEYWTVSSTGL